MGKKIERGRERKKGRKSACCGFVMCCVGAGIEEEERM